MICDVAIIGICILGFPFKSATVTQGLSLNATAHVGAATVHIWKDDIILTPDIAKLSKYCDDIGCVYYHRRCNEADGYYICVYNIASSKADDYRKLSVRVRNKIEYDISISEIGVALDREPARAIPLSKLEIEAQSPEAPWCGGRTNPCPQ